MDSLMRPKTLAWLGLAAGLLIGGASVAQDWERASEQDEGRTRSTTGNPPVAEGSVAQPRNSQQPGAAHDTSPSAHGGAVGRMNVPQAAAGGPLRRINTKPLSASANIALPQDI